MKPNVKFFVRFLAFISIAFLIAFLTVCCVRYSDNKTAEEQGWFVCTRFNMNSIADAISNYVQTNRSDISKLTNFSTYVQAGKMPEWSSAYVCPNWFKVQIFAQDYNNVSASNLFTGIPLAANVSRCSYYIEMVSTNKLRVRCLYHTNVLNCTVDIPN
jgi:hypothetical protein